MQRDCNSSHLPNPRLQQWHHKLQALYCFFIRCLTKRSFFAIGQHCRRLQDFCWSILDTQSIELLEMITLCPLVRLKIIAIKAPLDPTIMAFTIRKFRCLICLDIMVRSPVVLKNLVFEATNASNLGPSQRHGIGSVTTPWPWLTQLTLSKCDDLDGATLVGLVKLLSFLQQLTLKQARQLEDSGLDALTVWLPNVTHVTLTETQYLASGGIRQLICNCQHLEYINLYYCWLIMVDHFQESLDAGEEYGRIILDQISIDKIRKSVTK